MVMHVHVRRAPLECILCRSSMREVRYEGRMAAGTEEQGRYGDPIGTLFSNLWARRPQSGSESGLAAPPPLSAPP